jgi:hypothetical protein
MQDRADPSGNMSIPLMRLPGTQPARRYSRWDPAAQWTGAHQGHAVFAYADNYLIDLKTAIMLDVEATRGIRQARSVRRAQ